MNRRIVAAIAAVALAVLSVIVLLSYVSGVNERAFEGAKLQTVVQVNAKIPAGTPATKIGDKVTEVEVPVKTVAKGAVTDLRQLADLETTVPLQPGEQLLTSRFAVPGANDAAKKAAMPKGLQEVTVAVTYPRAVAGHIKAGDKVGVIASYDNATNVLKNRVLITEMSDVPGTVKNDQAVSTFVTFAVGMSDAEKIVHAAEFGKIYLTNQNADTDTSGSTKIETKDIIK